jgi:hypothetical protein
MKLTVVVSALKQIIAGLAVLARSGTAITSRYARQVGLSNEDTKIS